MSFTVKGIVINGNKIGRRIGFPTANISVEEGLEILNGVYEATVELSGIEFGAMVNLGFKPTLGSGQKRILEAHIFDFTGDIYGQEIAVTLGRFVRSEKTFDSFDHLREQIAIDRQNILNNLK